MAVLWRFPCRAALPSVLASSPLLPSLGSRRLAPFLSPPPLPGFPGPPLSPSVAWLCSPLCLVRPPSLPSYLVGRAALRGAALLPPCPPGPSPCGAPPGRRPPAGAAPPLVRGPAAPALLSTPAGPRPPLPCPATSEMTESIFLINFYCSFSVGFREFKIGFILDFQTFFRCKVAQCFPRMAICFAVYY